MLTIAVARAIRRVLTGITLALALGGCGKSERDSQAGEGLPPPAPGFRLHLPPFQNIPVEASSRKGEPLDTRWWVGGRIDVRWFLGLDTVDVPLSPSALGAQPGKLQTLPFKRWFSEHRAILDSAAADTVTVMIEKLESFKAGADWARSDGGYFLLRRGILAHAERRRLFALEDSNLTSEAERSVRIVPRGGGQSLLLVRTESAPGSPGQEHFDAFGVRGDGALKQFAGALDYVRDKDIPATLKNGQVFYAHVPHAGFHFLLPITFELERWRFSPEFGDDAVFAATGEGHPRLEGSRTLTMPIYLHPLLSARHRTVAVGPDTRIQALRFYGPWLVFSRQDRRFEEHDWLQVRVDSLMGWIPDALYSYVGLSGQN